MNTYLLIDTAKAGKDFDMVREKSPHYLALHPGDKINAPCLFVFNLSSPFADWYIVEGHKKTSGLFICTALSLDELHQHFIEFLITSTPGRSEFSFRFHEPHIFRALVPSLDEQHLKKIFNPVTAFAAQNENPNFISQFEFNNGRLINTRIPLQEFLADLAYWQTSLTNSSEPEKKSAEMPVKEMETLAASRKWSFMVE